MTQLISKYLKDYSVDTLRDVEQLNPLEEHVLRYDSVSSKWKNIALSIKTSLKIFKLLFTGDVLIEADHLTLMASPCIEGELIVNGHLEVF